MSFKISDRMAALNPSAIREILKYTALPGVISFAAGGPSAELYPAEDLRRLSDELYKDGCAKFLNYGSTEGYTPLRDTVKARLHDKYNAGTENDDLIILTGGQQGMDLAAKCLCNEGDTIICEDPTFIGALNCFRTYRLNIVGIPMDSDGMRMDKLEEALKREKNVRMIYTIDTFQNPMGVTLSYERRKKMYELASKYDVMIFEDSPYFELRYSGDFVPLIKSLDTEGRVIFAGSVSKTIAPALRVGYTLSPIELNKKMMVAKQVTDVHTPLYTQMLANGYMTQCDFDGHIRECAALYRQKRDRMLSAIERWFPAEIACTKPDGGLFIWFDLPEGMSGSEFSSYAVKKGVACVPGSAFDLNEDPMNRGVRLNFSVPSFEEIDKGIEILGGCIREFMAK